MFALLAATRFVHFSAICSLFGLAAFPFYAGREQVSSLALGRVLLACSLVALVSGGLVFLAMVGTMGETWASAVDPAMIAAAVTDTEFGRVWMARSAWAVVTLALCLGYARGHETPLLVASAILLASVALTGHSALPGGVVGKVHQLADGVHLLAAGWWVGGLIGLLMACRSGIGQLPGLLGRFSRMGYAAVAALILSGLVKSAVLIVPRSAIVSTVYGRVLLAKVGLFGVMGLLALSNRVRITPALASGIDPARWRKRLVMQVAVEFGLGLLVLAIVGALGAMSPPISD